MSATRKVAVTVAADGRRFEASLLRIRVRLERRLVRRQWLRLQLWRVTRDLRRRPPAPTPYVPIRRKTETA